MSTERTATTHGAIPDTGTKPNFFIVGAPRCGTTALSEYLRTHPDVFVSTPKEINYFISDMSRPKEADSLEAYLKLFNYTDEAAVGEASVWYLYSKAAIGEVLRFNPSARILIMVRNPVDMLLSWHSHRLYALSEDEPDFETAWNLQEDRSMGLRIPKMCLEPELLQYRSIAMLGEQVERAMATVPKDQLKVIVFDDFVSRTAEVYDEVLAFLSIPGDGRTDFPQINQGKQHNIEPLAETLKRPPKLLKDVVARLGVTSLINRTVRPALVKWNSKQGSTPGDILRPKFRQELFDTYRTDVERLGGLLNRDLSHWLKV